MKRSRDKNISIGKHLLQESDAYLVGIEDISVQNYFFCSEIDGEVTSTVSVHT